jgi:hypothetical protein
MDIEILERKAAAISEALVDVNLTLSCLNDLLYEYNKLLVEHQSLKDKIKEIVYDMQSENRDLLLHSEEIEEILNGIDI